MNARSAAPPDARVLEILDEYLAERRAGRTPDRDAILARHPELAESLEASFRALDFVHDAGRTLAASAEAPGGEEPPVAGRVIDDYRILREIARGGMAVVYEAEQISLGRRVALKVLPFASVLDPRQLQRFRHEAQAAARIQHPHIVPVHAVGCERGVHYYAMQYVEGQSLAVAIRELKEGGDGTGTRTPITSYGTNRAAGYIRMVVALGVQAAQALDHAHQVGIVHRDVKPGNLLVDLAGTLWVTDFGLAHSRKGVGLTMTGELLGTIRYMSPEQALAKPAPVDHRTDVYSLGATLYELFTLEPAFPGDDPVQLLKDIATKEPAPPRRLNPALPRDVETVLLKAMSKDPAGRYETAGEMADDLARFLENRPVEARRPGLLRRTVTWGRRNRALVGVAAAVLLLAVAGLAIGAATLWREQEQTQAAFDRAESNMALALRALDEIYMDEAESHPTIREGLPRDLLPKGLGFYGQFERKNATNPDVARWMGDARLRASLIFRELGQGDRAAEALDRAISSYREAVRLRPDDAEAHNNLAHALLENGDLNGARDECREAIRCRPDYAPAHNYLGNVLRAQGDLDGAIRAYREAIRVLPEFPGAHYNLGGALKANRDLNGAIRAYREAIRIQPDDSPTHNNLGNALKAKGDLEGAIQEYREAIRLKPENIRAHDNLGSALNAKGDLDGAIKEWREACRIRPDDAGTHVTLGNALQAKGDPDGAIREFREAVRLRPDFAEAHCNLGNALSDKGDLNGAIPEYREAIRLKPALVEPLNGLGIALQAQGDLDGAIGNFREAIRVAPDFAPAHYNLADALRAKGNADGAIAEFREAIRLQPDAAVPHYGLGNALSSEGDLEGAIREFREAVRLNPNLAEAHCNLGIDLQRQGHFQEALLCLRKGHELGSKRAGWTYPSKTWLETVEPKAILEGRLDRVLSGEARPTDALERIAFAGLLYAKSCHAESARMYAEAFAENATLAEDLAKGHRYNAACSASLAAARGGADAAEWRGRAVEWLRADLAARKEAASGLVATLEHWRKDPDLASVRERIADLREPEREACRGLWAAVDEALATAGHAPR